MVTSEHSQPSGPQVATALPILFKGSVGDAVGILQQVLNFKGFPVKVDRNFGSLTEQTVKDFQSFFNLKVDGIVGTITWHQLSQEFEEGKSG
jgi:peptidoglycan hydrolase-like protein with peptidoglycan-binding domain